jgi:rod shape-determining protein MreD
MRWLTFVVLGIVAVSFQTTTAVRLTLGGVRADFVFILLVHYALHGRHSSGVVAGWVLGLMMGLTSLEPPGLVALVYGVMALLISSLRDVVFTRHPLTHLTLTAVFCCLAQLLLRSYFLLAAAPPAHDPHILTPCLLMGLYSGAWAIVVHHLLLRCGRALGLQPDDEPPAWSTGHAV